MPLTLTIRNADQLENGSPLSLVLDRRGAIIGRAATADWSLPDPSLHISSRHCEVRFVDGRYELIDRSTNGTFLRGEAARLPGHHVIRPGDVFVIGRFEVHAALDDAAAMQASAQNDQPSQAVWKGWASTGDSAPAANAEGWAAPPPSSAISGSGPMSQSWAPPAVQPAPPAAAAASPWGTPAAPPGSGSAASSGWAAPPTDPVPAAPSAWGAPPPPNPPAPVASPWGAAPPPPTPAASEWSSPHTGPSAPTGDDIWGKFAQSNVVDWARGGFGSATSASPPGSAAPAQTPAFAAPTPSPSPAPSPTAMPATPPPTDGASASADPTLCALAEALGIPGDRLEGGQARVIAQTGALLRRLIAGMVVMVEARARAKSQLGAQSTSLEFDGNNPLKFARTPEQAILQLLNPPARGFMDGERAVEDAFRDLQAHQMATLKAMQGALRTTLDRFSPKAIRSRAEDKGILSRILPGARDAALWAAYEREFSGVAQGSDEAFMDMFAKEFRRAYEEAARQR